MPEKCSITVEDVVVFAVNHVCEQFEKNEDKRGLHHDRITRLGELQLIDHFGFPGDSYRPRWMYNCVYHGFLERYALRDSFPNGGGDANSGGDPQSGEHYWKLRNGVPRREEFKDFVLGRYRECLHTNLSLLQES